MNVFLTTAVWGHKYARRFVEYSLASQLSARNVPFLTKNHNVTYHIATTREDGKWLQARPEVGLLAKICRIDWDFIEDQRYDPAAIPVGPERAKYSFLSVLQNLAIAKSLEHDAISFNYADFVWADGSLSNAIGMLRDGVDAVLSFGLPVDQRSGQTALRRYQSGRDGATVLTLPPRAGAALAINHLHREAKLRLWNGPRFSVTPTYLIWPVSNDGLVVRAYHQTILAMRVMRDSEVYRRGIRGTSLDGHFTAYLGETGHVQHATNSDDVFVFSLFDTPDDSSLPSGLSREEALQQCLRNVVSEGQRQYAEVPIEVRRNYDRPGQWEAVERDSLDTLTRFHRATPFDREGFDQAYNSDEDPEHLAAAWRVRDDGAEGRRPRSFWLKWLLIAIYRRVLLRAAGGRSGRLLKKALGRGTARKLRQKLESYVFPNQRTHRGADRS